MSLQFQHPFTAVVSGPSGSGKKTFVARFIQSANLMICPPPRKNFYCYASWQPLFERLHGVTFHEGLPDKSQLSDGMLLILDDMMDSIDQRVVDIFTEHSHHVGVSVLFLTQNIFNKNLRTMTLNAHYIV